MQSEWIVPKEEAGQRLDLHLAQRLGISRAAARRLLAREQVRCAQCSQLAKGDSVQVGWRIEVARHVAEGQAQPSARPDLPLQLLVEREGWLAVAKPAGQGVHPLHVEQTDTLLNAALARYPELAAVGESPLRGGVVHRLDVDTSGVLLLARDQQTHQQLRDAFRTHRVLKRYLARVEGKLERELRLELELEIAQRRPARVRVASDGGRRGRGRRRCLTTIHPLRPGKDESLVEARPVSGYLHQIRVSLAHCGHPILGDRIYGQERDRLWLHAWQIQLPELGIDVQCPPAAGFDL